MWSNVTLVTRWFVKCKHWSSIIVTTPHLKGGRAMNHLFVPKLSQWCFEKWRCDQVRKLDILWKYGYRLKGSTKAMVIIRTLKHPNMGKTIFMRTTPIVHIWHPVTQQYTWGKRLWYVGLISLIPIYGKCSYIHVWFIMNSILFIYLIENKSKFFKLSTLIIFFSNYQYYLLIQERHNLLTALSTQSKHLPTDRTCD